MTREIPTAWLQGDGRVRPSRRADVALVGVERERESPAPEERADIETDGDGDERGDDR